MRRLSLALLVSVTAFASLPAHAGSRKTARTGKKADAVRLGAGWGKRKPVDLSSVRPDGLLLHARAAADYLDVPIEDLARLLPPPDRIINGRRHWLMSTLQRAQPARMNR